jgi:prepilin-type N-terminal cleavage/methylation domain-containing protein
VRSERGFTILELMIVVGIIAVLATVVVPSWFKDSSKSKAKSEVSTMFGELQTKEEAYMVDNATYFAAAACPATPAGSQPQDVTACVSLGTQWATLRVALPTNMLLCSYQISTGAPNTVPALPAGFTLPPSLTGGVPNSWYFIVATCDMDNDSTLDSTYYVASYDNHLQAQNEGY